MDHRTWLKSLPGAPTQQQAAERGNVDPSTLSRQLSKGVISMQNVRDIARGAGLNAAVELVKTGHLDPTDLDGANTQAALQQASVTELLDELVKRAQDPQIRDALDAVDSSHTVIHEHNINPNDDELAERRRKASAYLARGNYAADTTPTEPLEGDDDYHDGP